MALETKCQENARAIAQQIKNSGGSGSEVTVTQVLTSGTKIATIKVDDDSTDLYCETVPATPDADDIAYDNTTSGLTATNVQDAIDEVAQGGGGGSATPIATITGDGATTFSSALDSVFATMSAITNKAYAELTISGAKYIMPVVIYLPGTVYEFALTTHRTGGFTGKTFRVLASSSEYLSGTSGSISNDSGVAISAGDTIKFYA